MSPRPQERKPNEGARASLHAGGDDLLEEVLDKPFDRKLAWRLISYVRPYRGLVLVAIGLMFLGAALSLVGPLIVKEAVDGPLAGVDERSASWIVRWLGDVFGLSFASAESLDASSRSVLLNWLWLVVGVYSVVLSIQFVSRYAQTLVMHRVGQGVMRDLRIEIFSHVQGLSLRYLQKNPVGRLVTRVTSDVEALNELFTAGLVTLIGDVLTLVAIVVLMVAYNWQLALFALSIAPALVGVTILFRTMARKYYREIRRRMSHLNAYAQESIIGLSVIQISGKEKERARGYADIGDEYYEAYLGSIFWYALFFPSVEILSAIATATVAYVSSERILDGVMTYGEFFLFWLLLTRFFEPVRDLADKYNLLQAAMASAERIFSVIDATDSIPEPKSPASVSPFSSTLRFENVSFAYDPDKPVLEEVSFEVTRGETVALVGATGAGKSTVLNLLLRFYDPTSGRVVLDGRDIREYSVEDHRARFGLVLQDVSVFSRTVHENIDLDRDLSEEAIRAAAREVNALSFIESLPEGFQQKMRERGLSLSSGQRQLLSFARALAARPEILVLDEATSHIDTNTELLIQDALDRLVEGRTSFVVAHRLSTIRRADRILVFHHGRLREEGRHDALLREGGLYARLHRLQFGGAPSADSARGSSEGP